MSPAPTPRRRPPKVAGLVLAAGAGTRFGGPKALAELDGERLVDRAVRLLRVGGCDPVLVVLGAAVVEVAGADAVVVNPDWPSGMGSSLRAGLTAPELSACSAVVLVLVDQPGIRAEAVRAVLAAHERGAVLAVASYEEGTGHPVLLGREHWAGVAAAAIGDVGARDYLAAHADQLVEVDCTASGDAHDADTPQDLAGRGLLTRIAGDLGAAGGPGVAGLVAGMDELGALLGGSGARARVEEKAAQEIRRETQEAGQPPFDVDLDSGVVRLRRSGPPPQ